MTDEPNLAEDVKVKTEEQPPSQVKVRPDLFQGVKFCLCDNVEDAEEVKTLLVDGGGKLVNYLSDTVTHLIADSDDHPDVSQALEIYEKPVVTSRWVRLSAKADTILPCDGFNPSTTQLFSGIIACPSKLTRADVEACWAMITFYGGSFQVTLDSACTHLISTKPEGEKYDRAISTNDKIKIVTPDWVLDSVKNKTRCDEELYHPSLLLIMPSNILKSVFSQPLLSGGSAGTITNPAPGGQIAEVTAVATSQVSVRSVPIQSSSQMISQGIPIQGGAPQGRVRTVYVQQQHQVRMMQVPQRPQQIRMPGPMQGQPDQQQQQLQQQVVSVGMATGHQSHDQPGMQHHQMQSQQQQQQNWINQQQQQHHQLAGKPMQFPQDGQIRAAAGQPRQVFMRQQHPNQQQQIRQVNFVQIQGGQNQQQQMLQQQHPGQNQQQQHYGQQQQQQQGGQVPSRGGQVILQQRIQPPVMAGQAQSPNPQIVQQQQQQQIPMQLPNQQQPQQGQQVRMMTNQQFVQLQRPQQGQVLGNMRGPGPQQQVIYQQQVQRTQMPGQPQHQLPQQQMYGQVPQAMSPQQVQRVPQLRTQQMSPRGQIRHVRGQQIPVQGQTILQTNPDGTTQRILVRPQHFQQHIDPQQQQQMPQHGQGPQQMMRVSQPGQFIRGQGWPEGQPQPQPPMVRPPQQQVVMSPQQAQNQQQQMLWQQQQEAQRRGQQQHQQLPGQPPLPGPPGAPRFQGQPVQRFAGPPPQVNQDQVRPPAVALAGAGPGQQLPSPSPGSRHPAPTPLPPASLQLQPHPQKPLQQTPIPAAAALQQQPLPATPTSVSTATALPSPTTSSNFASVTPAAVTSALVTPKTKTALANLLNNRLQNNSNNQNAAGLRISSQSLLQLDSTSVGSVNSNGNTSNSSSSNSTPTSLIAPHTLSGDGSFPSSVTAVAAVASFSLAPSKLAYVGSPGVILPCGEVLHRGLTEVPQPVQEKYYGQEPGLKIPPKLCLIGCVFHIIGFECGFFELTAAHRKTLEKRIKACGAEIETEYSSKVTHIVTESQHYPVVDLALREGKRLVNVYWINDVIMEEKKVRPPWRPMHIPMARAFLEHPLKDHIISTTGFSISERNALREMIVAIGARFTTSLAIQNTVLLCKKLEGEKHKKAIEWCLPIVNTQWLFDVYFGVNEPLAQPVGAHARYRKFDSKDHFELDYASMRPLVSGWRAPVRIPEDVYFCKVKELETRQEVKPKEIAPIPPNEKSNDENIVPAIKLSESSENLALKYTVQQSSAATSEVDPLPFPTTTGSEVLAVKRSNNLVEPCDKQIEPLAKKAKLPTTVKTEPSTPVTPAIIGDNSSAALTPPSSQLLATVGSLPPPPPLTLAPFVSLNENNGGVRVLITSLEKAESEKLEAIVKRLGGKVTAFPSECTHLVTSKIVRTEKFVRAFNTVNHIVLPSWLLESNEVNRFVGEAKHVVSDTKGEVIFGFNMRESLCKRNERGPDLLFKQFIFYITPGCFPSPNIIERMVRSAGGQVVLSKAPTALQLSHIRERGEVFVVISCPDDSHLCKKFYERGIYVLNYDFVPQSILKQEIDYDMYVISKPA